MKEFRPDPTPMPSDAAPPSETWYRLSATHTILATGGDWDRFARDNDAPELVPAPLGTSVYDHMEGDEVRAEFRRLLEGVARNRRSAETDFRCDSPGVRRYMRLRITPEDDGGFRVTSHVRRFEARPAVSLLDRWQPRSDLPPLTVCAWCRRGLLDDEWVELDVLEARLELRPWGPRPQVSHSICDDCSQQLLDDLDRRVPERP